MTARDALARLTPSPEEAVCTSRMEATSAARQMGRKLDPEAVIIHRECGRAE